MFRPLSKTANITNGDKKTFEFKAGFTIQRQSLYSTSLSLKVSNLKYETVALAVFDLSGRKIATIAQKKLLPGLYEFTWNHSGIPDGCYMITMQTNTSTAKMKWVKTH